MITINLLPRERKKSAAHLWFKLITGVITLAIVVLAVVAVIGVNIYSTYLNHQLGTVESQLEERAEVLELVTQLEEHKLLLDEKQKIIDQLVLKRIEWGKKLHDLAGLVPDGVWLEKMQLETVTTKVKIDPPKTTSSRTASRSTRQQFKEIRTDYLHIFAVTDDMERKSSLIGDFISRIEQDESFFSDFEIVDFKRGDEKPWIERDKESPLVWRFNLTLKIKGSGETESSLGEAS